ncbi:MAG: tetratricopeptide repeat protein [Bacteroidales bacterium]|nr:tetratricopeptide repeat protein [Bacteroidales bacterium]
MTFFRNSSWIYLLFIFFFAALALSGKCQRTLSSQALKAIELFENKNFEESAEIFRKLINRYPGDPLYTYYYAACLIELNQELDVAESILKNVLEQFPSAEGYYYLGVAYYKQFRLEDANRAFAEAKKISNSKSTKAKELLTAISNLENFKTLVKKPANFTGKLQNTFKFDSILMFIENSKLISVYPVKYLQYTYFSYVVKMSGKDTASALFFSAPGKYGLRDIYCRYTDKNTGKNRIELLSEAVNSEADEVFPIYVPAHNMLIFATNHSSGLGGYDIYYCKTDPSGRPVGIAEPFPFPVNSQWNDYVFIPCDSSSYYLITDRVNRPDKVSIYRLWQDKAKSSSINSEIIDRCFFINNFTTDRAVSNLLPKVHSNVTVSIEKQMYDTKFEQIKTALLLQKSVDSLLITNWFIREKLDEMSNDDSRKALYAQWKKNEEEIKARQVSVNEMYKILVKLENPIISDSSQLVKINLFSVEEQPIYSAENPIPEQLNFPAGIVYTIQLGVFSKKVNPSYFGGIQPIVAELLDDKKLVKYYAGVFSEFASADSSLQVVRRAGFKEAFIVAYYDNKKIPLSRAQELEKSLNR